jgi:predicted metalloprotease
VVWTHYTDQRWHILEAGDVGNAITAAQAIGDDRLQKQKNKGDTSGFLRGPRQTTP